MATRSRRVPATAAATRSDPQRTRPQRPAAKKKKANPTGRQADIQSRLFDARPDRLDFRDLSYSPPLRSLETHHPPQPFLASAVPANVAARLVLDQGKEVA